MAVSATALLTGWAGEAPTGTLSLAAATEEGVYLVVDGELWFRRLARDTVLP